MSNLVLPSTLDDFVFKVIVDAVNAELSIDKPLQESHVMVLSDGEFMHFYFSFIK